MREPALTWGNVTFLGCRTEWRTGGLVAHDDGFALLTGVSDANKWGDTAAALIRYKGGSVLFDKKLTGAASNDTSPVLDCALKWNGSQYGAYFVVHGAGGFVDGHYGDKLAYVDDAGTTKSGGWDWGCSHNEGIALAPAASGPFPSLCFDDWRSGLFVSTGISAPDDAPVVQREQCWAGYRDGAYPNASGDPVKTSTGGTPPPSPTAERPRRSSTVLLTDDPGTDHINVRITPYGRNLLVSWESVADATCKDGTCTESSPAPTCRSSTTPVRRSRRTRWWTPVSPATSRPCRTAA
ncbi:hypothetical protein OG562_22500 [Streptomyces sp. NBC_01275]|uniref:hypothetical protein n=1 Tax=Streptomyces sp. NBC_01275 TaxID=2903807 RepID=UPI00225A0026|nr:hypothetical protein [Streptomyces sp. NBC_01275]MCX4763683.1 hypothetical protein [Streptomyces sp. NBC_01275]